MSNENLERENIILETKIMSCEFNLRTLFSIIWHVQDDVITALLAQHKKAEAVYLLKEMRGISAREALQKVEEEYI